MQPLLIRDSAQLAFVANFTVYHGIRAIGNLNGSAYADHFARSTQSTRRMDVHRFLDNSDVFRYDNRYPLSRGQLGDKETMFANKCSVIFRVPSGLCFLDLYGYARGDTEVGGRTGWILRQG